MNRLLDQLPLNTLRNNMTGQTYQFQSGKAPVGVDYSRPVGTWARKLITAKTTRPQSMTQKVTNKIANLIADVAAHNRDQDRAYLMQKRQMDLQTEALQQKKMQQELSNAGRAPVGYRYTVDGNGMEVIPGALQTSRRKLWMPIKPLVLLT